MFDTTGPTICTESQLLVDNQRELLATATQCSVLCGDCALQTTWLLELGFSYLKEIETGGVSFTYYTP